MIDFLASKVAVLEQPPQIATLRAYPSAVPGYVGISERGVLNTPTVVGSWDEYVEKFGGFKSTAQMPLGVRHFFLNGGSQAVIMRRLGTGSASALLTLKDKAVTPLDTLKLTATSPGVWANGITGGLAVAATAATSGKAAEFNLVIYKTKAGTGAGEIVSILESWTNLSMVDAATNYVETVLNHPTTGSLYVTALDLDSATPAPNDVPAVLAATDLAGGLEGAAVDAATLMGTTPFAEFENFDITLLAVPELSSDTLHEGMITFCEVTKNREVLAILDPPASASAATVIAAAEALTASEQWAYFWPRVRIPNPDKAVFGAGDLVTMAPSGAVCGVCARNDGAQRIGPFAQPAGIDDGLIYGIADLESDNHTVLKESTRNLLAPARVNPITSLAGRGIFIDGTMTGKADGNFPSIGERRGVSYLEKVLKDGTQWARHKNNNEALRGKLERTVYGYLLSWCEDGAFASQDPDLAFIVDADVPGVGINNARAQAQNKVYVKWGVATAKPATWVIHLVSQDTRAMQEAAAG
jgi:phage tail sheath protein FI